MERVVRIELTHQLWKSQRLPLHHTRIKILERVEGIEPSHGPWQGSRLPLHHTRAQGHKYTRLWKSVKPLRFFIYSFDITIDF